MARSEDLQQYRRRRDFRRTPEPAGTGPGTRAGRSFVIQKHAARRLHYDLRLELNGVLKSWAVPKGPSLDPHARRLAVHVEDHPIEYATFEGVIPPGEYGGGAVIVWDNGTWEPEDEDPEAAYRRGTLRFTLKGKKLIGRWTLVRLNDDSAEDSRQWLLIKGDDAAARRTEPDITVDAPDSVLSGRSLDDVAARPPAIHTRRKSERPDLAGKLAAMAADIPGARQSTFPRRVQPQLATLVRDVPAGDQWLHEIKYDGYRLLMLLEHGSIQLSTRNGQQWTARFPALVEAARELPEIDAVIDGEAVVMRPDGTTDFQALQNTLSGEDRAPVVFFGFDLLYCGGHDLSQAPLLSRKDMLRELLTKSADGEWLRYSDHITGGGHEVLRQACDMGIEGIVSKQANAPYRSGRTRSWTKTKCLQRQEFVIAGYTPPGGSRSGFGSLALGYYDKERQLKYAGRVGTGFNDASLRSLAKRFAELRRREMPFDDTLSADERRDVQWLEPVLVGEVEFSHWTNGGRLRHPSFQGLREDKAARDIGREVPVAMSQSGNGNSGSRRASDDNVVIAGVTLTHPDKVLYPAQGITKRELAEYYLFIAEHMLPHVAGRPLSLVRCPQGHEEQCFFQKHFREELPDGLHQVQVREKEATKPYAVIDNVSGLIGLVQLGVLEIHAWGAHDDRIERPDMLVFDLDPAPDAGWEHVIRGALLLRLQLGDLGLESFVRTSGGKGLHVVLPIARRTGWDEAKAFTRAVAQRVTDEYPDRYIAVMSKAKRTGKIFIDYLRNGRSATSIASYSTRARPGGSVAVPLAWEELPGLPNASLYTVRNISERLARLTGDPWEGFDDLNQVLTKRILTAVAK